MNMDFSEEAQKTVVTAYKMGFEAAAEKSKELVITLKRELEESEAHWEKICNQYSETNHKLKVAHERQENILLAELTAAEADTEKYRAALQKVMDDCKWWSRDNWCGGVGCPCHIALRALEVKDEQT
jgi:alkylated DNA nucleotide flippase Atl1